MHRSTGYGTGTIGCLPSRNHPETRSIGTCGWGPHHGGRTIVATSTAVGVGFTILIPVPRCSIWVLDTLDLCQLALQADGTLPITYEPLAVPDDNVIHASTLQVSS